MKITDEEINNLNIGLIEDFSLLLIKYLCGEKYPNKLSKISEDSIKKILTASQKTRINCAQFNELLLLLNQDRMGEDFFEFIFEAKKIPISKIPVGVSKFRCYAMLSFGNFMFAYRFLKDKSKKEIDEFLLPYSLNLTEIKKEYTNRPKPILNTFEIDKTQTYFLGEITFPKLKEELTRIENMKREKSRFSLEELDNYKEYIETLQEKVYPFVQEKGLRNTDIYLTWDYMDVYVATSMRNKWEFEETYTFIRKVFPEKKSKNVLSKLKLRYFDPTQSKCSNSRDKGLIEGLMLKRVSCTIYMVQETDTLGKDSELATTLAQRNPVIAYVPNYSIDEYAQKIMQYPLDYFKKRLMVLKSDGTFLDPKLISEFIDISPNYLEIIENFLAASHTSLNEYEPIIKKIIRLIEERIQKGNREELLTIIEQYPGGKQILEDYLNAYEPDLKEIEDIFAFSFWEDKEIEFKQKYQSFTSLCKLLSIAECNNFKKRAETLKWRHPLSIQIDINTGVANGLFVVRSAEECIKLLYSILTNTMEFSLEHVKFFNVSPTDFSILCALSKNIKEKCKYDPEISAIYQIKTFSEKDYEEMISILNLPNLEEKEKELLARVKYSLENINQEGGTILKEKISSSPYRFITDNDKLSNSFWNQYY